ncbi:hypothetical protein G7B40_000565 [Aetokthonos hydrillicola Thurmond2011]|jgi:hypothetical protein|uniref:Uncharacterized protein n=1 Tax=Aetokthonos hydrillicola Thurmond2011 TaxID=2712845 RepID=A0AAP5I3F4_9CYAN|nr:hypothetical protein [Aetokthonos hydrillicola]MBO3460478.1 hypothetical protein [Aetokthonos hydrillicola CCALA 1050]MBW4588234.1 hypothetical protein [Aetokthonos hydrillicola CCALA 1050]MDR9893079.1 hypothetical protein [Aetokthonos hydrillicola Thurmond2011]
MQFIKIILVALVFILNLIIVQPSWAGKDFTKGADYIEVTQALNQLLSVKNNPEQAGYTPEEFQERLSQLQSQKYVMETAKKRAQCHNETGRTLGIYANKPKKYPTQLYFLAAGQTTDDDWDCDGIYLPAGSQVVLSPNTQVQELTEPIAVKFVDGTQSFARTNLATGAIEFSVPPAKVFKVGEVNWLLPTLSQADIDVQVPSPQIID